MEETAVEGTSILVTLIIWIIVGGLAGWLASNIVKGGGMGLVGNIVLGIVGAVVAGWLLPVIGLNLGGIIGAIISAMIGAILVLLVISLIKRA
ncbi:MAG: GlsB/YeaQ/YmgE family stress response membrane protein [Rhodobacteraceae bacterium]|nr:GlsB/YeaQ/YmgE family stress response membrane protein [Paracoccaceae bacterium]